MAASTVAARLEIVRERIADAAARSRRASDAVTLVGVSKGTARVIVDEAYAAGLRDVGENRVQEAQGKFATGRPDDLTLHLIGHLQTNKARDAVRLFSVVHSVDSAHLIDALQHQAARIQARIDILLEINISGEEAKQGAAPEVAEALALHAAHQPQLRLRGLMTVAPLVDDAAMVRPVFAGLRELRDRLVDTHPTLDLPDLSMGMSNDYAVAIAEGATIVRIGRAIFGS